MVVVTVKIYARGSERRLDPPGYYPEMQGIAMLVKRVWDALDHRVEVYGLSLDLRWPYAEMVILTPLGMGVVGLRHTAGPITLGEGNRWWASGATLETESAYANPHQQVQAAARRLHEYVKLILLPKGTTQFELHTAICFTHARADPAPLRGAYRAVTEPWENFSLLAADELVTWAGSLRFDIRPTSMVDFALNPGQMDAFITAILGSSEWPEFYEHMPRNEPYAYLRLGLKHNMQTFPLIKDDIVIGRNPDCDVVVPSQFTHVSRRHAHITRHLDGIYIEDLGSHNGTYVNAHLLEKAKRLENGNKITLGRILTGEDSCQFTYLLPEYVHAAPTQTKSTPLTQIPKIEEDH
jgi:hypothetical protein